MNVADLGVADLIGPGSSLPARSRGLTAKAAAK